MKLLIIQKHSTNKKISVDDQTVLFLTNPESFFSDDLERNLIQTGIFEEVDRPELSNGNDYNIKSRHICDFGKLLLDCTSFDSLEEICSSFARKFDCSDLTFYSNPSDVLKRKDQSFSCIMPICSGKEMYGVLLGRGKDFDVFTLSIVSDYVTFKVRDLLIHNPRIYTEEEVLERHGEKLPVVLCGVDREVTKFLAGNLIIESDISEIRNVCRINRPSLVLISEDPMVSVEDICKIACDMRDMYATENAEIFYFTNLLNHGDLKKLESSGRITVLNPAILDNPVFKAHLVNLSEQQGRPLTPIYQTFNRVLLDVSKNLNLNVVSEKFFISIGVSYFHLSCYSKYFLGMTLRDYQIMLKVYEAEKLLKNSSKTIKEIYQCCGFTNYNSFSKYFYKFFGCIPSNFVERKRK